MILRTSDLQPKRDHLYVIESNCGSVKIGRSTDVAARIKALLTACPPSIQLTLMVEVSNFGHHEFTLHEAMHEHRIRGEWFSAEACVAIRTIMATRKLSEYILEMADAQTSPRYVVRNRRFAALREQLRKEEQAKEQAKQIAEWRRGERVFGPMTVPCPLCGAEASKQCREPDGELVLAHSARMHTWEGKKPPHQSMYKLKLHIAAGHHS